ncbi:MAG: hypothetical protein VX589_06435 [Myxococcota bacterium]|nr:hypothetical protein [Myxococcota bacterium]
MHAKFADTWAERAQAELGAARRFKALACRLSDLGTHPKLMALVSAAEHEEYQHASMCAAMAKSLGHPSGFSHRPALIQDAPYSWHRRPNIDARDRTLLDVVLMCCITESLNASLLNTIYGEGQPGKARRLIRHILQDEVKHAQIGWAYLSEVARVRSCHFIADDLAEMLDVAVRDELFLPMTEMDDAIGYEMGIMPTRYRLEQFELTIQEVLMPGFEHLGIDAHVMSVWLEAQRA